MNKVFLIGNLTAKPELRATPNGNSVCNFNLAVNRSKPDKDGNKVTDFFRVTAWNKLAENCDKYLDKGKKIAVLGELCISTYTDKDGNFRVSKDVEAAEIEFLTPKGESTETAEPKPDEPKPDEFGLYDVDSSDLPF